MLRRIMVATAAAAALSACSASFGSGGTVPEKEVEKQAASALTNNGTPVQSVDCPRGLKAKVNATLDCSVSIQGGQKIPVTLTVSSVKDGKAQFTVRQKQ